MCEVAVLCYDEFGSGGYLWLSKSYTVTVAQLWEVFQIVYSCTGSYTGLICKMNSYLCRNEIFLNLFWLKILLLPIGVWSLGWLAGTCSLWGRFEILYSYVSGALHLKPYHL